jgi:hypothetical protein
MVDVRPYLRHRYLSSSDTMKKDGCSSYGASGQSYSIVQMATHGFRQPLCERAAYIDDFRSDCGRTLNDIPIISFDEWKSNYWNLPSFVAVADPKPRPCAVGVLGRDHLQFE